jgi:hypothetical protein
MYDHFGGPTRQDVRLWPGSPQNPQQPRALGLVGGGGAFGVSGLGHVLRLWPRCLQFPHRSKNKDIGKGGIREKETHTAY